MKFRALMATALLCICSGSGSFAQTKSDASSDAKDQYLFVYFKEPGSQGIYYALSQDGFHYEPLNDGQPWLKPSQPGEIMRDIFVTRDPAGGFHAVWTWGWRGNSFGTADSPDLMQWGEQHEIPIMTTVPGIRNVWAPETDWDASKKLWVVFWSSSPSAEEQGNRIWFSETKDFRDFSAPKIFFDPGYEVIDATMYHAGATEYLIYKDQTRDPQRYQERVAKGPTVEGPWTPVGGPINDSWSEGPSAIKIGDEVVVFYDHYRQPQAHFQGVATKDWIHWHSVNDRMSLPQGSKHGAFLKITAEEAAKLRARHDPPATQ
ncbi:hypothetical protein SAMN05421819_3337 [Bryocella elongata]|uniref:Glycosyl hydrolases family 43 n=1 Tax=Bryocella elongata TaxID=863522 RepID=A0A1H6AWX2_9BACT|nr:glycoside hydrolase family 43 protein [Bryocella elongata]SEG53123.1 hypothetical protein SAMN05421819_3337 [Bryocella elongata]